MDAGRLEVEQGMLNPLLDTKSSVDWTFIVSIFINFSSPVILFGDSICGEKRDKGVRLFVVILSHFPEELLDQ